MHDSGPLHVASVRQIFSQVPGLQTVPRAETWVGAIAIKEARHEVAPWWCDAAYTVLGSFRSAITTRCQGANGDVWCELQAQLAASPDLSGANKIKAHQTTECVRMGKLTSEQYLGNGLADVAAVVAGEIFQESATILTSAEADFGLAVLLNLRLATIEAHCWIVAASKRVPRPVFPDLPKIEEDDVPLAGARKKLRSIGHRL